MNAAFQSGMNKRGKFTKLTEVCELTGKAATFIVKHMMVIGEPNPAGLTRN